ncbi:hypothetical protein B2_41 [Stenotrophomonas phage B2]|nr:hypothetical protein B2_41 [Stenotrophomonas phage B2]
MNQKPLETIIRAELLAAMATLTPPLDLPVILGNQSTGQGRVNGVYFFRMADGMRGWQSRRYQETAQGLNVTESQWVETQYQFQALVKNDPLDPDQLLASDVVQIVRSLLGGVNMAERLHSLGVGVQRPSPVLTPWFVNEQNQYDSNPSFTLIFSHRRELSLPVNYAETVTGVKIVSL